MRAQYFNGVAMKSSGPQPFHILMADTDMFERRLFEHHLKHVHNDVNAEIFKTCASMLERLNTMEQLPDVILLEVKMIDMSGIDCLRQIRSEERLNDVKIAVYTNSNHSVNIQNSIDAGADYYIIKPHDFDKNVDMLNWIINDIKAKHEQRQPLVLTHNEFTAIRFETAA